MLHGEREIERQKESGTRRRSCVKLQSKKRRTKLQTKLLTVTKTEENS